MRVFLVSATGYAFGIAPHLEREGHSVHVCYNTRDMNSITPDITIVDSNIPDVIEKARSLGSRILGITSWSALLDTDLIYKNNLIKAIGYNATTTETAGANAIISCWFNGHEFISKSIVLNYTKFMAGDVGVNIECSGYIAYFDVKGSKLVNDILEPLKRFLRKVSHKGCFSVEVICNDSGVYVKDISASITKPYTQAVFENTRMPKADIMLAIMNESSNEISYVDPYVCGILLTQYPYPYQNPQPTIVTGINSSNLKHLWVMNLSREGELWKGNGCIGYAIARGISVEEAKRRAYRTIANLESENLQYRNDIGKDANERLFKLRQLKLL